MTVPNDTDKAGPYTGNGVTTSFPFSFRILDASHIRVVITDLTGVETDTSDFSVAGVGDPSGTVIYPVVGTVLPTGYKLTIVRDMPFSQLVDIANAGAFYPEVHEEVFDGLMMSVQQVREEVGRAVKVSVSDTTDPDDLIASLTADAAAAAASASAASASATTASGSATAASASAVSAASSAATAAAAADGLLWSDVVFLTFADSPYTVTSAQKGKLFAVDSSGGAISITLPTIASSGTKMTVGFKKTSSDGNTITVNRAGSDTIDGGTSKQISNPDTGATFVADTDPAPDRWTTLEFGARGGNMTLDTYTGNGATVAFTLSAAPGSANNVAWYEGGVRQKPGTDYTVAGTTLTRTTAPLAAVPIFALTGTTLSVGVPSDATVTYAKLDSAIIPTAAEIAAGTANKIPNAANLKTYVDTYVVTPWVAYTPTLTGFGTATAVEFFSRRVGDTLEVRGRLTAGTTTAVEARFSLGYNGVDGGLTTEGSDKLSAGTNALGYCAVSDVSAVAIAVLGERSVGYGTFGRQTAAAAGLTKVLGNAFLTSGQSISFFASYPIDTW